MTILHFLASTREAKLAVVARTTLDDIDTLSTYAELEVVLTHPHIRLAGLCCNLGPRPLPASALRSAAGRIVALMERVRREHGVILTELVLEVGAASLPELEASIDREEELSRSFDDALDDACAANRFPHPTVALMTDLDILVDSVHR
ncbi:hypothetical protein R4P64_30950 [Rhodococcus sp. IEGM 1366]|uniref:hypothetical protein n=1 Tax=Rhodococcus sp. IEGM 1366 TaxID=3082223 RepID=UPI002954DD2F|nr:hypothetical protein [Rhodococcus sp. IEGM 1366]MDV8070946.1 hypothetical protein [Rhodococcus sp. IEGM 1366]